MRCLRNGDLLIRHRWNKRFAHGYILRNFTSQRGRMNKDFDDFVEGFRIKFLKKHKQSMVILRFKGGLTHCIWVA